jgi:CO dehydrogenase maturation factor
MSPKDPPFSGSGSGAPPSAPSSAPSAPRPSPPPPAASPHRLVVCGKGGVGKTTVSALIARHLARAGTRALLVDADHAGGLEVALGITPERTLEDVRLAALQELRRKETSRRADLAAGVDYRLLSALVERDHLAFLALGRPEDEGCYCAVNRVLKHAVEQLSADFQVTLIDAEAGLEQINRDVLGSASHLVLVADPSVKALRVAQAAHQVSARLGLAREAVLLVNRVPDGASRDDLAARAPLPIAGLIPDDPQVQRFDAEARPFFELPDGPATAALGAALPRLGL